MARLTKTRLTNFIFTEYLDGLLALLLLIQVTEAPLLNHQDLAVTTIIDIPNQSTLRSLPVLGDFCSVATGFCPFHNHFNARVV